MIEFLTGVIVVAAPIAVIYGFAIICFKIK